MRGERGRALPRGSGGTVLLTPTPQTCSGPWPHQDSPTGKRRRRRAKVQGDMAPAAGAAPLGTRWGPSLRPAVTLAESCREKAKRQPTGVSMRRRGPSCHCQPWRGAREGHKWGPWAQDAAPGWGDTHDTMEPRTPGAPQGTGHPTPVGPERTHGPTSGSCFALGVPCTQRYGGGPRPPACLTSST